MCELTTTRFLKWLIHGLVGPVCAPLFRARVHATFKDPPLRAGLIILVGISIAAGSQLTLLPLRGCHALLRFWHSDGRPASSGQGRAGLLMIRSPLREHRGGRHKAA